MSQERGPRAKSYSLAELGLAPKTTSERVDKLRKDRAALGLKRKEVYVHDDDWPELLKMAKRLERRRAKLLAAPRAG